MPQYRNYKQNETELLSVLHTAHTNLGYFLAWSQVSPIALNTEVLLFRSRSLLNPIRLPSCAQLRTAFIAFHISIGILRISEGLLYSPTFGVKHNMVAVGASK